MDSFLFGPRRAWFFSSIPVRNVLARIEVLFFIELYPAIEIRSAPRMFIERSCIVSIKSLWRPEWIMVSRVNSKTSQSVAKDNVREKIMTPAKRGLVFIRFVLCRTWIIERAVKPRAREAVKVISMSHQIRPW